MTHAAFCMLVAFLPTAALAAEQAHGGHGGIPWATLTFSAINLALFLYLLPRVLTFLGMPPIGEWVKERRRLVIEELEEAARARREAEQLQAEWRQRIAHLDAELEELRRQAEADTAAERDKILAAAQKAAEAIHRDAQRAAEQEIRNASAMLRAEVAKRALDIARTIAPQQLTAPDHQRFVAEFLEQVEK